MIFSKHHSVGRRSGRGGSSKHSDEYIPASAQGRGDDHPSSIAMSNILSSCFDLLSRSDDFSAWTVMMTLWVFTQSVLVLIAFPLDSAEPMMTPTLEFGEMCCKLVLADDW